MKFDPNGINTAIVHTLADLLCGEAQRSAKHLQGSIGGFFLEAADWKDGKKDFPEGFCYPYRADSTALNAMCEAIFASISHDESCRHSQFKLIQKICEISESYMNGFRGARQAGTYSRNTGYICNLSTDNDWGRQMLALKGVFCQRV